MRKLPVTDMAGKVSSYEKDTGLEAVTSIMKLLFDADMPAGESAEVTASLKCGHWKVEATRATVGGYTLTMKFV